MKGKHVSVVIELKSSRNDEKTLPYALVTLPAYGAVTSELQAMSEFLSVLSKYGLISGVRLVADNAERKAS